VLPKTFNVFHQIPGRVLFQARAPIPPPNGSVTVLKELHVSTHGVDFPAPLWSKKTTCKGRHAIHYQWVALMGKDKLPDLVLIGVEEAAILLIAPAAGTTSTQGVE
jgi:hypothetical protein